MGVDKEQMTKTRKSKPRRDPAGRLAVLLWPVTNREYREAFCETLLLVPLQGLPRTDTHPPDLSQRLPASHRTAHRKAFHDVKWAVRCHLHQVLSFRSCSCSMWDLGPLQLSAMLVATFLLLTFAVLLRAQFPLYQTPPFQFVDVGGSAEIACISSENTEHRTIFFSWYKRRESEAMRLVKSCFADKSEDKFACKAEGKKVMLKISNLQVTDSGLYLCAESLSLITGLTFGNGSSLVVGDSYTPSSWVMMLLQPAAASPAPRSEQSDHLACVVHGVSGWVQVSWDVPGGLRQEGQTLLVKNSTGSSLTVLSLLRIPTDSWTNGELYGCEVRFNSSGPTVKKSVTFNRTSSADPDAERSCLSHTLLALSALLALLLLLLLFLLALLGIRLCRSRLAHGLLQPRDSEPPASEEPPQQEDLAYAQLDFGLKTRERSHHQRQAFLNPEKPT